MFLLLAIEALDIYEHVVYIFNEVYDAMISITAVARNKPNLLT